MEKQRLLELIAKVVPAGARNAVPHAIKEPIVSLFSTEKPPPAPHFLEQPQLPRAAYDALWRELFGNRTDPARNYFETHRDRYYELFNAIAYFHPDWKAELDVLEIGVSEFAAFYKRLFPHMRLATLDRPVAGGGADAEWSRTLASADRHYNADLNTERISTAWGEPPLGTFDLVVCTEVIEHLVIHPVDFLGDLVGLLKPHGMLYLTTPNFFCAENLARIARRENPQAVYPRRGHNWDAHHHFREMTMPELHGFAEAAGGRVITSYFSACWDLKPPLRREERSNLVAVIAHQI